jgi:hypothetical protein
VLTQSEFLRLWYKSRKIEARGMTKSGRPRTPGILIFEAIDVLLYRHQLQGCRIRGPRNPVHVCAVLTHPHMHATCSL